MFSSVSMTASVDETGTHSRYAESPTVSRVDEQGSAGRAGLRPGDVLHAVDGLEVTTVAGTVRLTSIHVGETVIFTVLRGDKVVDLVVVAR
jgi:S1-C subfamily serine protease